MRIALFAAFPQELRHIARNLRIKEKVRTGSFNIALADYSPSSEVVVVESGMGIHNTQTAFSHVVDQYHPDFILSVGFGGALYDGASIGDLVWASKVFLVPAAEEGSPVPPPDCWQQLSTGPGARDICLRLSLQFPVREGNVLTLTNWVEKSKLMKSLPAELPLPVSDMETYFFAKLSAGAGLPFLAVRSITDSADEEIPRELLRVTDEAGNYKLPRALGIVLSSPQLIPDIVRLGRNSHVASRKLWSLMESLAGIL